MNRCSRRTGTSDPAKSQVRLPDVQPGDRPTHDHPLNFARSLKNGEDPDGTGSLRRSAACGPPGISTDSARPVREEFRLPLGPERRLPNHCG
jgi:hypothetical protein